MTRAVLKDLEKLRLLAAERSDPRTQMIRWRAESFTYRMINIVLNLALIGVGFFILFLDNQRMGKIVPALIMVSLLLTALPSVAEGYYRKKF